MPYEYAFETIGICTEDVETGGLSDWLNMFGQRDWRIVALRTSVDNEKDIMDFYGIFERKIAINKNLRALQLGMEIEKETLDDGTTETDKD